MDLRELKEMTKDELISKLSDVEEEQFKMKFQNKTTALKNPMILRNLRKDIARIKTILREKK